MTTFEEAQYIIDQLCHDLPQGIFAELNCGVATIPDTIYCSRGLLVLGMYHYEPYGLGRYVTIHYGSMLVAYGHLPPEAFKAELKRVLHHELTHHIESLAGDKSLEHEDERNVAQMLGHLAQER